MGTRAVVMTSMMGGLLSVLWYAGARAQDESDDAYAEYEITLDDGSTEEDPAANIQSDTRNDFDDDTAVPEVKAAKPPKPAAAAAPKPSSSPPAVRTTGAETVAHPKPTVTR